MQISKREILWKQGYLTLQALQSPLGLAASSKEGRFHAIFGRDSLWSLFLALETLSLHPFGPDQDLSLWLRDLTEIVLTGLASLQGTIVNDFNEEQPGKIIHEFWDVVPERVIAGGFPLVGGRYYGSFDSTFLYLMTVARAIDIFDDRGLLERLWPSVEAALNWMLDWSDLDQDGRVEYARRNPDGRGLINQAWKDSNDSVWGKGVSVPSYPLTWIEMQGYAWSAYQGYLHLARKRDSLTVEREQEVQKRMRGLNSGLSGFWLEDQQFPAMALDGQKQPIPVVSSNPGHLLYCGMLTKKEAELIAKRFQQPDMLTPWGVRCLSDQAAFYNPTAYHSGTVWPFDNAIVAIGLSRYGYPEIAREIGERVLNGIEIFGTPIEVYSVLPSRLVRSPHIDQEWLLADYFYGSGTQAWTAAAMLYFIRLIDIF